MTPVMPISWGLPIVVHPGSLHWEGRKNRTSKPAPCATLGGDQYSQSLAWCTGSSLGQGCRVMKGSAVLARRS